jgi:membrane-bound transcription factor site-1 protease
MDFKNQLSPFSSRGMTTWELPFGYGRVKPDVLAFGQSVIGSSLNGGCKTLSGKLLSGVSL